MSSQHDDVSGGSLSSVARSILEDGMRTLRCRLCGSVLRSAFEEIHGVCELCIDEQDAALNGEPER